MDIYHEYCIVELEPRRAQEERLMHACQRIPPSPKRSSAQFLIQAAMAGLDRKSEKYLKHHVDKSNWTMDDHDIRFIVRLVYEGRCSGRWWENLPDKSLTGDLCTTAYRLLCWLRFTHKVSTASSPSNQQQRAVASEWYRQLTQARRQRLMPC